MLGMRDAIVKMQEDAQLSRTIDTRALDAAVRCYRKRWQRFIAITTSAPFIGPIDEETIALIRRAYRRIVKESASAVRRT